MHRQDLAVQLRDQPGALAELGETLGRAGVSLEGGGGFTVGDHSLVHFLVGDGERAAAALRAHGITVVGVRDVIEVRLDQEEPGQLGKLARAMATAGVNIECVYSDHEHRLILVVDDLAAGRHVAAAWADPIARARAPEDIAYVRAELATLDELARGRSITVDQMRAWAGVHLPRATYMLPGGELRYAHDWWRMFDEAGGIDGVSALFAERYRAAGGDDLDAEWAAYLAGLYGACLREVTPENIVAKARLVDRLEHALAEPRPEDPAWCRGLRSDVDALDRLARPFAACDRARFGRPTSRDRLIDVPRERFPHAFQG